MKQHLQKKKDYFTNHNKNNDISFLLLADDQDIIIDSENKLERGVFTLEKMEKNLKWKYCKKT